MWIATLAIAGIPPFAGFFSKDEILGRSLRARHASQRDLVRRSGCMAGARGGAPDRDLHDADDALHLPRPEPHRRTGAVAPARGAVGHDGPAGRAGRARRCRRLAQPARRCSAATHVLEHWLEPVIEGAARCQRSAHTLTRSASGRSSAVAVAIAVAGIVVAWRLLPRAPRARAQAPAEQGFERVLWNKYYVDECTIA